MNRGAASLIIIGIMLIPIAAMSAGATSVEVLRIDDYGKAVAPGGTATFNWTLRNIDELSKNLTVETHVPTVEGWNATISPTDALLMHGEAVTFTLTVIAPEGATGSVWFTVTFSVTQEGALLESTSETAEVEIPLEGEEGDTGGEVFGWFENPLPPPLDNDYGVFLLDVLIWIGISGLALIIMDPVVKWATRRSRTKIDDKILAIIRTPIITLIFLYGAIVSLKVISGLLGTQIIDLLERIYNVVVWIIIFYVAYKLFKEIVIFYGHLISHRTATELDDVLVPLVEKVGVVLIGIIALGTVLGFMGVDLTLFIAGGFVMSLVIAFAAQETLSNFFSGLFLLSDRPFKRGDTIILGDGTWYEVRDIGIRSTRLYRFSDAAMVTIPNNKLANEMIANFTNPEDRGKIVKTIGVAYGTDTEEVKRILREIIESDEHIVTDDPDYEPIIRFDDMDDSAILFKIIVWLDDRVNRFAVIDRLNTEIHRRFGEEGIEIPFPQRVIHMRREEV